MRKITSTLAAACFLAGCAAMQDKLHKVTTGESPVRAQYQEMRPDMLRNDWKTASAKLEAGETRYYDKETDRVMFLLNKGTLAHYATDFDASQTTLVEAESTMQDLWTKSIHEMVTAVWKESSKSYAGEDYERVLLYLYTALNNVRLRKIPDALVEARRADSFLRELQVAYEKDAARNNEPGGTLYKQDAFMLWLVGLFYEMEGSTGTNDALLAYKASYEAYSGDYANTFSQPPPSFLGEDIVRTARAMKGFREDADKYSKATGATGVTGDRIKQGMGEVVLIHANGEAPYKEEFEKYVHIPGTGENRKMAFPRFLYTQHQILYAQFGEGDAVARTETVEPITQICLKNYDYQLAGMERRTVLRAVAKSVAKAGVTKAAGARAGKLANFASNAVESADIRSWTTLPADVGVGRLWLPAGTHKIHVSFRAMNGMEMGTPEDIDVTDLKPGEHRIISVRSIQ